MSSNITKLSGCSAGIIAEIEKMARNKNPNATDRTVGLFVSTVVLPSTEHTSI